ncbi:EF-hand domain-containing protein [uncultured Thiohalocapsa sp.]|uniref:EF-hand domain-containing protein n=1 Tax=uncultured Thiohalocapsa sp. TaxID=768990 RepID=UPI0025DA32DF|nr:EF-hand domain-containing protein [uncultured Thiohalocapsa sp.]
MSSSNTLSHSQLSHRPMGGHIATALIASALLLTVSAGALAQPGWGGGPVGPGSRGPASFAAIDSNGDGSISAEEHASFRAERMAARAQAGRLLRNAGQAPQFEDLDANRDGRLSQAEVAQFRGERMAQRGWPRGGGCNGPRGRGW